MSIDIIVPYVDESDKEWQKDFNYYKELEIKKGIQTGGNRQAFASERVRDWDAFKYWFRAVETNCPWVNKVFLVVQRESQIPQWLDRNNPKLRIVYHSEFIPEELLPTFSTLTIEAFYYRIHDLSEHFIVCNDDFFFLNPIDENLFFRDDKIIQGYSGMRKRDWTCGNDVWERIIQNNNDFLERYIIKRPTNEFYHYSHLPDGRVKSFEIDFMSKYYDEVYKAMSISRFRHPKNLIPSLLYIDTMKYTNYGILDKNLYKNCKYVAINQGTKYKDVFGCKMVCFNDTAEVGDNFIECKKKLIDFLHFKFPTSCSFEKQKQTTSEITPLSKVFGIISWLPNRDPARGLRIERLNRAFNQIVDIFGDDVQFLVIAQNWQNYWPPDCVKNIRVIEKKPLGILGARKCLREEFLKTDFDYLIMCDDDVIIEVESEDAATRYMEELDKHPNGFMFLQYDAAQLNMCAISRNIYKQQPMVDVDPQKGEGFEDVIFAWLLHYKFPKDEFYVYGVRCTQFQNRKEKAPSTWAHDFSLNMNDLSTQSWYHINKFKQGNFLIDKVAAKTYCEKQKFYERALEMGWINKEDIGKTC